jgi:hypothetical protein
MFQPLKMEQIDGSETSACKNQTPRINPEVYSQYPKHGESFKSRIVSCLLWVGYWLTGYLMVGGL